jgi:Ala-tRNA(Pro) deacylase
MAIAPRLKAYLKHKGTEYRLIKHPHTGSSMETAEKAHVPGDLLAKGVIVRRGGDPLVVVIPSDYHVELETLHKLVGEKVELVHEVELPGLFPDCERGAVPAVGPAYDIPTMWDPNTSLGRAEVVYFEAGDHEHLVRVDGRHFHELMASAERGEFSHHI